MPTRKQRRRKAKEQRHEYVWEDEEGNELDPEEVPGRKSEPSSQRSSARPERRPGREPQPPSWRRTLKRSIVFAPVMFLVVMFLSSDLTLANQIVQTALIVGIFVPFSYLIDGLLWRSYKRRESRAGRPKGDRGS
jgi:hypothetical protein